MVAALGDSITAGSPGFDPDPARRAELGFGDDEQSQYGYWAERADPALQVQNCGVFGEVTEEIAARLDECAAGADALIVQGGINDIARSLGAGEGAGLSAVGAAAQNIEQMVARGQAMDLEVAVTDVLPWNNAFPLAEPLILRLNDRIERIARASGATLLRFHDELEDPGRPGLMSPALTADGDHPSVAGYRLLGELVAAEVG